MSILILVMHLALDLMQLPGTLAKPLVWILHAAYAWIVIHLTLPGFKPLFDSQNGGQIFDDLLAFFGIWIPNEQLVLPARQGFVELL